MLVISELVTNAVRHAGAGADETIEVRFTETGAGLRVEVLDSEPAAEPRRRERDATGGLGLVVVSALCREWGTMKRGARKAVWADYPLARSIQQA
jgi:two-component sensor histidine kinase